MGRMDTAETIDRIRRVVSRGLGVPVEQIRANAGLAELGRLDAMFEEDDIVDVIEREFAISSEVIWDTYP